MSHDIDLRKLAELSGPDRAFLTVYLSRPSSRASLDKRIANCRAMLAGNKDERQQFDENVALVNKYLERNPYTTGSLCLFACWALDFFEAHPTRAPLPDALRVDSSPFLRPLSEMLEEYEDFAVVVAANAKTHIYLMSADRKQAEASIKGGIKNSVRKGGWSQQRYARRRDKELHNYAKQITESLVSLDNAKQFRRVFLVGSRETIAAIEKTLPTRLKEKVAGTKAVDLRKGEQWVQKQVYDLFWVEERQSEQELWTRIQTAYMRGGLAAVGIEEVLEAAKTGRVDVMLVDRDFHPEGVRCRDCEHLAIGVPGGCPECSSTSLFQIDVIEEIVELLLKSSADVEYTDPIAALGEVGSVAGLLRY